MPSQEQIFEKVRTALVDALGVDEEEVTPTATMVGDLGAESIDFLDIVFRLEKAFDIKIPRGELFPEEPAKDVRVSEPKGGCKFSARKGLPELSHQRQPGLEVKLGRTDQGSVHVPDYRERICSVHLAPTCFFGWRQFLAPFFRRNPIDSMVGLVRRAWSAAAREDLR